MRYTGFEIKNFRGIKHAKMDLVPAGAGVFTLIGLNESGKTTVLEAVSTFQLRGGVEKSLYQTTPADIDPGSFVPKHEKATFSGDMSVTAHVEFERNDKASCIEFAEREAHVKIDPSSVPDSFTIERGYRFQNGDQSERINTWGIVLQVKEKGARKFKSADSEHQAWKKFVSMVSVSLAEIVYFPTFLFEMPAKIVLNPTDNERSADRLYRTIIENVGASLDNPIDVKKAIVDRIYDS